MVIITSREERCVAGGPDSGALTTIYKVLSKLTPKIHNYMNNWLKVTKDTTSSMKISNVIPEL